MRASLLALPPNTRFPDLARHLDPAMIAGVETQAEPGDGQWLLAEVAAGADAVSLELLSGRIGQLYPGDPLLVLGADYHAPLACSGSHPQCLGDAFLLSPAGLAGLPGPLPTPVLPPPLRLLGVVVDHQARPLRLAPPVLSAPCPRPLTTVAVVSAARGARSSLVTDALVRGFTRMGLVTGVAKPLGMLDPRARWRSLDAGACLALDPADTGQLDTRSLDDASLLARSERLLSCLGAAGCVAGVLRVAGGLGVSEVRRLLAAQAFRQQVDGVVLAAADALSAVEGLRWLQAQGLPVLALGGAVTRSPLAMREVAAQTDVPRVGNDDLAQTPALQRLLSERASPADATRFALAA